MKKKQNMAKIIEYIYLLIFLLNAQAQNVGIGTNTPSARLHIEFPSGFTSPVLQVNQQGSATPYFIIQPNGNVGIGVASPSEALDVSGNIQFSGALMPGGNAGTVGQVLVSQGPGNAPVWQNATVVTDTPIVGVGTTSNPIGIMPGTSAGDVLIWSGSQWVIKPASWDSICNSATANFVQKWTGTELCNSIIYDNGSQVGIGTTSPAPSAILDISSSNKGVLLPRVTLSGYKDVTTIANPDTALMVYHKGIPNMPPGYYFWDGTQWRFLYTYDHTQVVFENVITPTEIFNNASIDPSETVTLEPSGKYIDFTGGASTARIFTLQLVPPGTIPSINSGAKYIIQVDIVRNSLLDDNGNWDSDEWYAITDSINGFWAALPDCNSGGCCNAYWVGEYTVSPFSSNTIDGVSYSTGPCMDEGSYVIEVDSAGSYVGFLPDRMNPSFGGSTNTTIDPANGLWLELYRTGQPTENYRIRLIRVRVTMTF